MAACPKCFNAEDTYGRTGQWATTFFCPKCDHTWTGGTTSPAAVAAALTPEAQQERVTEHAEEEERRYPKPPPAFRDPKKNITKE